MFHKKNALNKIKIQRFLCSPNKIHLKTLIDATHFN